MTSSFTLWPPSSLANMIGAARAHCHLPRQRRLAQVSSVLMFLPMLWFALAATAQDAARTRIDFVYFGSPDCPYCRGWEASDLQKLKEAKLFQRVRFTKITKAIGSPVPAVSLFPDKIKYLRDPIAEKIKGSGSPMFAILTGGHVVVSWRGAKKYSPAQILKLIELQQTQLASGSTPKPAVNSVAAR